MNNNAEGTPQFIGYPYTAMSLRLEAAFGLRHEESIKLILGWADVGDVLRLKASWTNGGKYLEVPIRTNEQRTLLAEAKHLAGKGSLIPAELRYRNQLQRLKAQCARVNIHGVHVLRHKYAQTRYEQLTGWKYHTAGGSTLRQLTHGAKGGGSGSTPAGLARAGAREEADYGD